MKKYCFVKFLLCTYIAALATPLSASTFTDWKEFPADPIYAPFPSLNVLVKEDYFPVVFNQDSFNGHGHRVLYKMWHQGPNGIALSYSNDGINWNLQSEVILDPNAFHPNVVYDKKGFGGGPYHYKMWYWTGYSNPVPPDLAINFTQSTDGINWTAPVATTQDLTFFLSNYSAPSTPFHQFYGLGPVIYNASATSIPGRPFTFPYVVFYDSSAAEIPPFTSQEAVALAYSDDGLNWIRYGSDPVLIPSGNMADWDGKYAYHASVIKLDLDNRYHMFYSGSNDSATTFGYAHGIGHASSLDGINWTKDPDNPIFSITDGVFWRSRRTLAPSVVMAHGEHLPGNTHCPILLQMWFSGGSSDSDEAIGYATLPDPKRCRKQIK